MKERPILFSAAMVNAILDGRKTMTRRVIKPQPTRSLPHTKPLAGGEGNWTLHHPLGWRWRPASRNGWSAFVADGEGRSLSHSISKRCPYGQPGDRFWVRETWAKEDLGPDEYPRLVWRADLAARYHSGETSHSDTFYLESDYKPKRGWTSPRFMPRWASRLTLEITDIRAERLNDVSQNDAKAEGVVRVKERILIGADGREIEHGTYRASFAWLWDEINGKRAGCAWGSNPWVWVVSFKRIEVANA